MTPTPSCPPRRPSRPATALAGVGAAVTLALVLVACLGQAPSPPAPVAIPPTPVIGRVAAPPEVVSRRLLGALYGHADLKPRHAEYVSEYHRPELGHPALATFSLFDARGSIVDDTHEPTDSLPLAERLALYPAGPAADPALAAYLALPVARRRHDLLIWVQDKYRWRVPEYRAAGGREQFLPYTSGYLVHLAPAGEPGAGDGTDIQVLGYNSRLRVGAGWRRPRDGLVPFAYEDILADVPPSLADRQALLAVLVRLAATDPPA